MNVSSTNTTSTCYHPEAAKAQPKKTTPPPTQAAPTAPANKDGGSEGSALDTYA